MHRYRNIRSSLLFATMGNCFEKLMLCERIDFAFNQAESRSNHSFGIFV